MGNEAINPPGVFIRAELEKRGWSQREFSEIIDRPSQLVNEIVLAKRSITIETALAIAAAFGDSAEVWLQRESAYQMSQASVDTAEVRRRARLFDLAPIKDMQRRGWIAGAETIDDLESELKNFFSVQSLDSDPSISASARKTDATGPFNSAQRAWAFRAKQLAKAVRVGNFSQSKLNAAIKKLKLLAAWPQEARKVPKILADCGIRFLVVEPLPHTRIDGVAFWIDDDSPVIAMSMRFDRIDNFWHVLGHEVSHIRHNDDPTVDADSTIDERAADAVDEIEQRANRESAATWIDATEMESFVRRVGPLYSKEKINQFANRIRVHPGIIIGQLQNRGEIRYQAFRNAFVKVRSFVTAEALTDGWGHEISF